MTGLLVLFLALFVSCTEEGFKGPDGSGGKKSLVGTWVNGDEVMMFENDSVGAFVLTDSIQPFNYSYRGDMIEFRMPDETFNMKVIILNDTLLSAISYRYSEEGVLESWHRDSDIGNGGETPDSTATFFLGTWYSQQEDMGIITFNPDGSGKILINDGETDGEMPFLYTYVKEENKLVLETIMGNVTMKILNYTEESMDLAVVTGLETEYITMTREPQVNPGYQTLAEKVLGSWVLDEGDGVNYSVFLFNMDGQGEILFHDEVQESKEPVTYTVDEEKRSINIRRTQAEEEYTLVVDSITADFMIVQLTEEGSTEVVILRRGEGPNQPDGENPFLGSWVYFERDEMTQFNFYEENSGYIVAPDSTKADFIYSYEPAEQTVQLKIENQSTMEMEMMKNMGDSIQVNATADGESFLMTLYRYF